MQVRRYEPKDFGQIIEICRADSRNEVVNENEYRMYLTRPDKEHYVVEMDGKLVALVSITEMLQKKRGLYLFCQIDPDYYGKGVGPGFYRFLLEMCQRDAEKGQAVAYIQACCDARRKEMLDFFISIGGEIVHHYQTMYMDVENCMLQPQFSPEYRVSFFAERDVEGYYILEKEVFTGHFTYNPKTLEDLYRLIKMPDFQWDGAFLLWKGEEMVGFCRTQYHQENASVVTHLGIQEAYRRRGLGRNLLLHGILGLQKKGATRVMLAVEGSNENAFTLYQRLGFIARSKRLILEKHLFPEQIQQEIGNM